MDAYSASPIAVLRTSISLVQDGKRRGFTLEWSFSLSNKVQSIVTLDRLCSTSPEIQKEGEVMSSIWCCWEVDFRVGQVRERTGNRKRNNAWKSTLSISVTLDYSRVGSQVFSQPLCRQGKSGSAPLAELYKITLSKMARQLTPQSLDFKSSTRLKLSQRGSTNWRDCISWIRWGLLWR